MSGRTATADEALAHVRSGMSVVFPHLSAEPTALTSALWRRAEHLSDLTVYSGMLLSGYKFLSMPAARNLRFRTWFPPGTLLRKTAADVRAEYLPLTWAQTARFLAETAFDVALVQVSPADAEGFHNTGLNCTVVKAVAESAKLLIAQVNENVPRTLGDSRLHASRIGVLVEENEPLMEYPNRPTDAVDDEIGRLIAPLVPDGAALSFGVGAIPLAAARALIRKGARDLTFVNTFTDPVMELIEAGCAQAANPKAFVGDIFGSRDLYRWVDGNAAVAMADALSTHSVEAVVARKNIVSVNSALEVDLLGQVNAETIDGKQAGAMGGGVDWAVSGQVAGSRFILGLRSRTNSGKPRIVRQLDSRIVSISRTFVETVVTEHGVAALRNKTVAERAHALAMIAHPDDRRMLLDEAAGLH